jgi:hypothetical protein
MGFQSIRDHKYGLKKTTKLPLEDELNELPYSPVLVFLSLDYKKQIYVSVDCILISVKICMLWV